MIEPAGQSKLMSKIAREENRLYPAVFLFKLPQDSPAAILGTIIHKNQLKIIIESGHIFTYRSIKMADIFFFIVNRDHN